MPSTLLGLLIFVYILIPGYCYYAVRKRLTPIRRVTTIVDAANVLFVAMVTNALMLMVYSILKAIPWIREHSPSTVDLVRDSKQYLLQDDSRLAYLSIWGAALLIGSSVLAIMLAVRSVSSAKTQSVGLIGKLWERYPARVTDESVWDHYFHHMAPDGSRIYLECHLHDESYAAGVLAWYNTDIDDSPNRDLVLSRPLTVTNAGGSELVQPGFEQHVILSARDIRMIIVTYVTHAAVEAEQKRRDDASDVTEDHPADELADTSRP